MALSSRRPEALDSVAAAAIGVLGFLLWAGPRLLDPTNVGWLRAGDRAIHTLGWWYYRFGPWGLPPGVNPRNGLEISNSVALSDSLPIFAIPFKVLAPLLPHVFQYWGLWLLLSMTLQALFGWALAREMRLGRAASLIFAGLVLLTPSLLLQQQLHIALASHWVLLAALYLYVRQEPLPRYAWPLLLAVTAAIHAYLLAMVLATWVAALLRRGLLTLASGIEFAIGTVAIAVVLWAAGFLMTSSFGAEGYGYYRLNLLSLFDPYGYSLFWPAMPHTSLDYEGLLFPGLGTLLLILLAVVTAGRRLLSRIVSERWLPLLLVSIALFVFAVTNRPVLGAIELGTIPLPSGLLRFAAIFRASGRMIWPVAYLMVLAAVVLLDRRFGARRATLLMGAALVVQVVDISQAWQAFARELAPIPHDWSSPMRAPFWQAAAGPYDKVRAMPVEAVNPDWVDISRYAALNGMASDATYLGRVDYRAFVTLDARARQALADGSFDADALYLLDLPSAIVARRFARPADLLGKIDGFYVFARNGAARAAANGGAAPLPALPDLAAGRTVRFGTAGDGASYLPGSAWLPPLAWGTTFTPPNANFGLHLPDGAPYALHLTLAALSPDGPPEPADMDIAVDGRPATRLTIPANGTIDAVIPLPPGGIDGDAVIGLHIREPKDPNHFTGTLPEVGVVAMTLQPAQ